MMGGLGLVPPHIVVRKKKGGVRIVQLKRGPSVLLEVVLGPGASMHWDGRSMGALVVGDGILLELVRFSNFAEAPKPKRRGGAK